MLLLLSDYNRPRIQHDHTVRQYRVSNQSKPRASARYSSEHLSEKEICGRRPQLGSSRCEIDWHEDVGNVSQRVEMLAHLSSKSLSDDQSSGLQSQMVETHKIVAFFSWVVRARNNQSINIISHVLSCFEAY